MQYFSLSKSKYIIITTKKIRKWEEVDIKYTNEHIHTFLLALYFIGCQYLLGKKVSIILDGLRYLQKEDSLKLYAYVILENHIHLIASSDNITQSIKKFKSFTAKEILKLLQKENVTTIIDQLAFYKKAHKTTASYQIWQEGSQPKLIQSDAMMINKINYIHQNPVKRGYVDEAKHWRYSSARDYEGINGLIEIERFW